MPVFGRVFIFPFFVCSVLLKRPWSNFPFQYRQSALGRIFDVQQSLERRLRALCLRGWMCVREEQERVHQVLLYCFFIKHFMGKVRQRAGGKWSALETINRYFLTLTGPWRDCYPWVWLIKCHHVTVFNSCQQRFLARWQETVWGPLQRGTRIRPLI